MSWPAVMPSSKPTVLETPSTLAEPGAVALIHGVGASAHDWDALTPALRRAGFRVCAPDLLGHGDGPHPARPERYTFAETLAQAEHDLMTWAPQAPWALVGHSLGGLIALHLALRHRQRVWALVLVNPFFSRHQLPPWLRWGQSGVGWIAWAWRRLPLWIWQAWLRWFGEAARFPAAVRQQIARDYHRASPYVLRIPATIPPVLDATALAIPTLIIGGRRDRTLRPASFAALAASLPRARLVWCTDCGHQLHLARPVWFQQQVVGFLTEAWAAAQRAWGPEQGKSRSVV